MGEPPSCAGLSHSLRKVLGLKLGRLKTGTPPRIIKDTVDFSLTQLHLPDPQPTPFSFINTHTHCKVRTGIANTNLVFLIVMFCFCKRCYMTFQQVEHLQYMFCLFDVLWHWKKMIWFLTIWPQGGISHLLCPVEVKDV